jgi:hypothetical protein
MGAPPMHFSQEIADRICEQVAGGMSLRAICKQDDMPSRCTVTLWLRTVGKFQEAYWLARAESADVLVEDSLEIADNLDEDPASRRVRVAQRNWIAARLKPAVYGDKVEQSVKHGLDDGLSQLLREIDGKSRALPG